MTSQRTWKTSDSVVESMATSGVKDCGRRHQCSDGDSDGAHPRVATQEETCVRRDLELAMSPFWGMLDGCA